tara:strand:- start:163 stop:1086 length:924 start_codon:yes stop_codon:yes gene_type:complete
MNRTLKRPMFKLGGPTSEGITSGLDKPKMASADMDIKIKQLTKAYDNYRQQGGTLSFQDFSKLYAEENFNSGGRAGYQTGGFSPSGVPGFLTGLGLNLLNTPPQGGLLSTIAGAAKDPFNRLQASQMQRDMTQSERDFETSLFEKGEEGKDRRLQLTLDAEAAKKENVIPDDILKKYEGNQIKAQREVDFYTKIFKNLQSEYGTESVSTVTIDSSEIPDKQIERFVKSNPQLARQVVYDVATGKAVRFAKNAQTNKFEIIPADVSEMDMTGEDMPTPTVRNPGYLRPDKDVDLSGTGQDFGIGFYEN